MPPLARPKSILTSPGTDCATCTGSFTRAHNQNRDLEGALKRPKSEIRRKSEARTSRFVIRHSFGFRHSRFRISFAALPKRKILNCLAVIGRTLRDEQAGPFP